MPDKIHLQRLALDANTQNADISQSLMFSQISENLTSISLINELILGMFVLI